MIKIEEKNKNISIDGIYSERDLQKLEKYSQIEKLSLTGRENITIKLAKSLANLKSVKHLFLWSSVNRTAIKHIISIPDLEILDILELQNPGKLKGFSEAINLKEFRCNHYMSEADLIELATLPKIQEIGAQNAELTKKSLESLLKLPHLINIDLEATNFNDHNAAMVANSTTIKHLSISATKLTSKGLAKISQMSQLKSLDIWSTDIFEKDLDHLKKLQNLEYLSIGGYEQQTRLTFKSIKQYLEQIPTLKKVWLDGIALNKTETKEMESKYDYFRN